MIQQKYQEAEQMLLCASKIACVQDDNGDTAVHLAAKMGDAKMLCIVLPHYKGAKHTMNSDSHTALHCALENGGVDLMKVFVKEGPYTKAEIALFACEIRGFKCHKSLFATLHLTSTKHLQLAFLRCLRSSNFTEELLDLLVSCKGFDVNCLVQGKTYLVEAIKYGQVDAVAALVTLGAKDNPDACGLTPVVAAVEAVSGAILDLLFATGNFTPTPTSTCLREACYPWHTDGSCMKRLLDFGVSLWKENLQQLPDDCPTSVRKMLVTAGYFVEEEEQKIGTSKEVCTLLHLSRLLIRREIHAAGTNVVFAAPKLGLPTCLSKKLECSNIFSF